MPWWVDMVIFACMVLWILPMMAWGILKWLRGSEEPIRTTQTVRTVEQIIDLITHWSLRQFPSATPESTYRHMLKEMDEIRTALETGDMDALAEEFTDMAFLAMQGIARCGHSPTYELARKLQINMNRQWAEPDEHGVVEHVR